MVEVTNWSSINNATAFLNVPNQNSGGFFWVAVLYMIVGALFLAFLNFGFEVAIMVALFIGIILGTLLLYLDLISIVNLGVLIGLELFVFIYLMFSSPKNN
jgi:hypothetical protein